MWKYEETGNFGFLLTPNTRDTNTTKFLDPERIRIRIRSLNFRFGLLIFTTFEIFKKKYFHSSFQAYFSLG